MGKRNNKKTATTAFHEAGHAVIAGLLGRSIVFVRVANLGNQEGLLRCNRHPCFDLRRSKNRYRTRRYIMRESAKSWREFAIRERAFNNKLRLNRLGIGVEMPE